VPGIAALFAVAYLPTAGAAALPVSRSLLAVLVGAVLVALAGKTAMRAYDWSGFGRLIAAEVEHHPNSLRANFQYAQLLMEQIKNAELSAEAAALAKQHFEHIAALSSHHADGLFGLVVLELYQGRSPPQDLIDRLAERLRRLPWGPLTVNTGQFAYLVKWHEATGSVPRLSREQMLTLFEAALANPTLPPMGRGAIYHALRSYYQRVLGELNQALVYADLAIRAMPNEWDLHDRRIRLLAMLGRFDEAEKALQAAVGTDTLGIRMRDAEELGRVIAGARRGEPVPRLPPERNHQPNGTAP
jgi:tetratricopeptide (TPR) repeat protein